MNSNPTSSSVATLDRSRFFYTGAAVVLFVLMFLGFQKFYLHGRAFPDRPLDPTIRTVVIAHGVSMTAWMFLLLAQPMLIVNRKHRVHMTLGKIGAVLAAGVFILGLKVGIEATKAAPPDFLLWNMPYKQFMAVPILSITVFAGFVAAGVWYRKRPEVHRPMMLCAAMAAIPAAMDRIEALTKLYNQTVWGTIFGPFFTMLILGVVFLVVKWALTRSFDRFYAMGLAVLVVASAFTMWIAKTPAWDGVANFLLRF